MGRVKSRFVSLAVALLCSIPAWAGNELGNGGDAVLCPHPLPGQKPIELLDYFEATNLSGLTLSLGGPALSLQEKIDLVTQRLARLFPLRAEWVRTRLNRFMDDAYFTSEPLPDVDDSGAVNIPMGCHAEQLAIQPNSPQLPINKRYFVNRELWNQLDKDSQLGLMIHEVTYTELRGAGNSIPTRQFNVLLATGELDKLSLKDSVTLFTQLGFDKVDFHGLVFILNQGGGTTFYDDNTVREGILSDVGYGGEALFPIIRQGVRLVRPTYIEFYPNGVMRKAKYSRTDNDGRDGNFSSVRVQGKEIWIGGSIAFYENGEPFHFRGVAGEDVPEDRKNVSLEDEFGRVSCYSTTGWYSDFTLNRMGKVIFAEPGQGCP